MKAPVKCTPDAPRQCEVDLEATPPIIRFRPCGFESTYPVDVEYKYCRVCQVFLGQEEYEPLHDRRRYD